jgi:hypothetical protein
VRKDLEPAYRKPTWSHGLRPSTSGKKSVTGSRLKAAFLICNEDVELDVVPTYLSSNNKTKEVRQ